MYLFTFLSTSLSSYSPRAYKFIMPRGVVGYASARMRRSMLSHWWITLTDLRASSLFTGLKTLYLIERRFRGWVCTYHQNSVLMQVLGLCRVGILKRHNTLKFGTGPAILPPRSMHKTVIFQKTSFWHFWRRTKLSSCALQIPACYLHLIWYLRQYCFRHLGTFH